MCRSSRSPTSIPAKRAFAGTRLREDSLSWKTIFRHVAPIRSSLALLDARDEEAVKAAAAWKKACTAKDTRACTALERLDRK
jgi:hypothetical protein